MLNCIAVDDEPLALDILEDYINKIPFLKLNKIFTDPIEALAVVQQGEIDLVFLDIQMSQLTGIQFLKIASNKCKFILTTAYPEYALEGYELDVVDYLLKPIAFDRFYRAAEKALQQIKNIPQMLPVTEPTSINSNGINGFIFIKTEYKIQKIYLDDILYIEGLKDYISIFTVHERIITLQNMKKMEENLPENQFIRVHKSYIISLDKIDSIERSRIQIKDKTIPIGDTYRDVFFKTIEGKNF